MQIYRHSKNVTYPGKRKLTDKLTESMEHIYPDVTYQHLKEVDTDKKMLVIGNEQRTERS
jgi:hypothetical protein